MKPVAAALLAFLASTGCETAPEANDNRPTPLWTTEQGTFARDPVSGNQVNIATALTRSYLGETYYFESEEHARAFQAHPQRFITDADKVPERPHNPGPHGVY